jgi:hypothetical protein
MTALYCLLANTPQRKHYSGNQMASHFDHFDQSDQDDQPDICVAKRARLTSIKNIVFGCLVVPAHQVCCSTLLSVLLDDQLDDLAEKTHQSELFVELPNMPDYQTRWCRKSIIWKLGFNTNSK